MQATQSKHAVTVQKPARHATMSAKDFRIMELWWEINDRLAELVKLGDIEFMPTLDGLRAQLFVEIEPDDGAGNTALDLRQNTVVDEAGAPIVASLVISKSICRRLSREKEATVKSLVKRHGKKNWDRLVELSRGVEAQGHYEVLSGRA